MIVLEKRLCGSILDIGGGGEGVIGRLYGAQVTAIDSRQEELDEAPGGFEKIVMDARAMTFPDEHFDHATCFYSLMFMDAQSQKLVLREAFRVLRPGGTIQIWDAEIPSAYPEPFLVELDIQLPGETLHTTYGIVSDLTNQTAASLASLCRRVGFHLRERKTQNGQCFLKLVKP